MAQQLERQTQNQSLTLDERLSTLLSTVNPKNSLDIFHSKNKSIVKLHQENPSELKALLSLAIIDLIEYINVGKNMNAHQVMILVNKIINHDYYSLHKIDYFKLCFERIKEGAYGKQYDSLDGQKIFICLDLFDIEYKSELEERQINQKKKIERDIIPDEIPEDTPAENRPIPMPDYVKEFYQNIGKEKDKQEEVIERQRTPEQLLIDSFIADFDKISGKKKESSGQIFIEVAGKVMDIRTYIDWRVEQYQEDIFQTSKKIILEEELIAYLQQKGANEAIYEATDENLNQYRFYVDRNDKRAERLNLSTDVKKLPEEIKASELLKWLLL